MTTAQLHPTRYRLIEDWAEAVIARWQQGSRTQMPPVPVQRIATECFGLRVDTSDLSRLKGEVYGALNRGARVISVNEGSTAHRQRFTVAHEIGHYVLPGNGDTGAGFLYGTTRSKDARRNADISERLANDFAGALLIPRTLLLEQLAKYFTVDARVIRELAQKFDVSLSSMLARLSYLGLYGERICLRLDQSLLETLWSTIPASKARINPRTNSNKGQAYQLELEYSERHSTKEASATPSIIRIVTERLSSLGVIDHLRSRDNAQPKASPAEILGRPFVMEFAGSPNAGKDTQIRIIYDFLHDVLGYSVWIAPESYNTSRIPDNHSVSKFDWSWTTTLKTLKEIEHQFGAYDIVILNRGLLDCLGFLKYHNRLGQISDGEAGHLEAVFVAERFRRVVDLILLMQVPPEISIGREAREARWAVSVLAQRFNMADPTVPEQNVVNDRNLPLLNECYSKLLAEYGHLFFVRPLCDDGQMSIEDVSIELTGTILSHLQEGHSQQRNNTLVPGSCVAA